MMSLMWSSWLHHMVPRCALLVFFFFSITLPTTLYDCNAHILGTFTISMSFSDFFSIHLSQQRLYNTIPQTHPTPLLFPTGDEFTTQYDTRSATRHYFCDERWITTRYSEDTQPLLFSTRDRCSAWWCLENKQVPTSSSNFTRKDERCRSWTV